MDPEVRKLMQRAVTRHQAGDLEGAARLYQEVLRQAPDFAEALNLHGVATSGLGRHAEACVSLKLAVALAPANATYQQNLGRVLLEQGDLDGSEEALRIATYLAPKLAPAQSNLGNLFKKRGNLHEAVACYDRALAIAPSDHKTWNNLGTSLRELKDLPRAEDALRKALAIQPDFIPALSNLGLVLAERGVSEEALTCFVRALELDSDQADLYVNYGNILRDLGRDQEASAAFAEVTVRVDPRHGGAWSSLGNAALAIGDIERAGACYRKSLECSPEDPILHFNQALYLLLTGDYASGFAEYEWGLRADLRQPRREFRKPLWQGESFAGETLLVYSEQGLGDAIQFMRFLPEVKSRGGQVVFEVHPALRNLLDQVPGADLVISRRDDGSISVPFDRYVALLSLPARFGITLESLGAKRPYLAIPEGARQAAARRFEGVSDFKVVVSWYGNPVHKNDARRSIPLKSLAPLMEIPGARFYAVAPGERTVKDIQATGFPIEAWTLPIEEAAAVIEAADLVITVDTLHAHLAGALGQTAWVLLPFMPDWRWLLKREDSPWYPSLRLFRQMKPGDWIEVVERVRVALAAEIRHRRGK
ncbi:MAG: tetratricopeptide repeat protein [Gammaproteobacteria bacterium]